MNHSPSLLALVALASCVAAPRAADEGSLESAAHEALSGVFAVGIAPEEGRFQLVGTAFLVEQGVLVTAGHVAEALHEAALDGQIVVKRNLRGPVLAVIPPEGVRLHQDYLLSDQRPYLDPDFEGPPFVTLADVAVLRGRFDGLGSPLRLAQRELNGLRMPQSVAVLGFVADPYLGEAVLEGQIVTLTATSRHPYGRGATPKDDLLHLATPLVAGASGSPVIDKRGRVIGVLTTPSKRLHAGSPTSVTASFAHRIELVSELLDPKKQRESEGEEARQRVMDMADSVRLAVSTDYQSAVDQVKQVLEASGRVATIMNRFVTIDLRSERPIHVLRLEPGERVGIIAAHTVDTDIDLVARVDGKRKFENFEPDSSPYLILGPFEEAVSVEIRVLLGRERSPLGRVRLQVFAVDVPKE